ncbi:hypothetical protein A6U96_00820 [Agrobacterium tumefaciens]|nr:hypothetical protein A6U96_00820 [Agrobacterium tumefaciens]
MSRTSYDAGAKSFPGAMTCTKHKFYARCSFRGDHMPLAGGFPGAKSVLEQSAKACRPRRKSIPVFKPML